MTTLELTRDGLIRALVRRARPAIDRSAAERAHELAARLADDDIVTTRVSRRGTGAYVVTVSGPGLFDREYGSIERAPDPVVGPALAALRQSGGDGS